MITVREIGNPAEAAPLLQVLRDGIDDDAFDRRFARALSQGYRLLGAYRDAQIVGVLGYRLVDDLCWGRTLFVDDLVVDPEARGHGIGTSLLRHAQDVAAKSCDHIRLCSGLSRHRAHKFYEANGLDRFSLQFVASF